jgi:hypothetical protein
MTLIGASSFVGLLSSYRLCWISGRFSGGKTSLAYRLAYEWLKKGYRLLSNNLSVWGDVPGLVELDEDGHLRAVVVLDEGGLVFKSTSQIEEIAAYAAKMDCIYLIPSFFPPTRQAQVVMCQPLFGLRSSGLPVIVYRWDVKLGAFRDKGFFVWWRPSEIYGVYSRQDPGDAAQDIVNLLVERTEEFKARYGRSNSIRPMEGGGGQDRASATFLEAANQFAEAADRIEAVSGGKRRRWRRQL